MTKLHTEERRVPVEGEAAVSAREPSPSEWKRVREATKLVIKRRRKVLEELAKH